MNCESVLTIAIPGRFSSSFGTQLRTLSLTGGWRCRGGAAVDLKIKVSRPSRVEQLGTGRVRMTHRQDVGLDPWVEIVLRRVEGGSSES